MTRTEDVVRVRSIDTNYLNARIEALEKEVQKLKDIIKQNTYINKNEN